jgi:hypothetical protein
VEFEKMQRRAARRVCRYFRNFIHNEESEK